MPRGRPRKKQIVPPETVYEAKKKSSRSETTGFRDIFRIDESYTSLLLGIVVVIIAAVLFLSLFRNPHVFKPKVSQDIATQHIAPTISPTQIAGTTSLQTPTSTSVPSPTVVPTQKVKTTVLPSLTLAPTQAVTPTKVATVAPTTKTNSGTSYIVKSGDTLWSISVARYNDGYQWTKIAQANTLSNPSVLHAGDKLDLPQITPTPTQIAQSPESGQTLTPKQPTIHTYTVVHGDSLWTIAVKVYGDGYQWTKIATANHLANPSLIFSGNVLTIP